MNEMFLAPCGVRLALPQCALLMYSLLLKKWNPVAFSFLSVCPGSYRVAALISFFVVCSVQLLLLRLVVVEGYRVSNVVCF